MPAQILRRDLPLDASQVSVGSHSVFLTCRSGEVLAVSRADATLRTLSTRCAGGNVVGDERGTFVIDVRSKRISLETHDGGRTLVEDMRLSGAGALDDAHLYFTNTDGLFRVARDGGSLLELARGEDPAILGVVDGRIVFTLGSFFDASNEVCLVSAEGGPVRRIDVPVIPGCARLAGRRLLSLDEHHGVTATDLETGARERLGELPLPEHMRGQRSHPFLKADAASIYFSACEPNGEEIECRWSLTSGEVERCPIPARSKVEHTAWSSGSTGYYWLLSTGSGKELAGWGEARTS